MADSSSAGGESYPRDARIRRERDILRLLREGRRIRTDPADLFTAQSPAGRPRLGVVVPLLGRTHVERNRLRRRLQELGRREWLAGAWERQEPRDLLIRARAGAYGRPFHELRAPLLEAFEELCSDA